MKRALLWLSLLAAGLLITGVLLPLSYAAPTATPDGGLPGRSTATPSNDETPEITPAVTSPFTFPTTPPELSPTPGQDCTAVFPIDNVEAIEFGRTTIAQLEASFGKGDYSGGRPVRFRYESDGCIMFVTIGVQEAQEAELENYGTLGLLLDRYGSPEAVGVTEGNLTLLLADNTVLLYPEQGIIAVFDAPPDDLRLDTLASSLIFRAAYDVDKQITRLGLTTIDWQPPLR